MMPITYLTTKTGSHLTPHNVAKAVNQIFKRGQYKCKWNAHFETFICVVSIFKRFGSEIYKPNTGTFKYTDNI